MHAVHELGVHLDWRASYNIRRSLFPNLSQQSITPHGVPEATARTYPSLLALLGHTVGSKLRSLTRAWTA